jgi:hypothetical protein
MADPHRCAHLPGSPVTGDAPASERASSSFLTVDFATQLKIYE